jgi:hypothetical protein
MALLENPEIATIPQSTYITQTTEPFKGPSVTIESTFDEIKSNGASPKTQFELEEHPVDQVRSIKVGIIGAGLSGITAGILLPAKLPGLDLRIWDKNADVVGSYILLRRYLCEITNFSLREVHGRLPSPTCMLETINSILSQESGRMH